MTTLQDALRELAKEREALQLECNLLDEAEGDSHSTPEYSFWLIRKGAKDLAAEDVKIAEAKVRELALDNFYVTENSRQAEGVQVKLFSRVEYEPALALTWCLGHATKYLQLDTRAFEKAAPVLRDLGAPVELVKEARVQIATDLDVWLLSEQQRFPVIEE
jgi:hypothetical protein